MHGRDASGDFFNHLGVLVALYRFAVVCLYDHSAAFLCPFRVGCEHGFEQFTLAFQFVNAWNRFLRFDHFGCQLRTRAAANYLGCDRRR